jgi:hypothetical protein
LKVMLDSVKLNNKNFYTKIQIWTCLDHNNNSKDENL